MKEKTTSAAKLLGKKGGNATKKKMGKKYFKKIADKRWSKKRGNPYPANVDKKAIGVE